MPTLSPPWWRPLLVSPQIQCRSRVHYLAVVVGHFDYKVYVYPQVTPGTWYCAHVHDNENTTQAAKELYRLENATRPHELSARQHPQCQRRVQQHTRDQVALAKRLQFASSDAGFMFKSSANNNMTPKKAINELKKFYHKFGALLATPNAWPE